MCQLSKCLSSTGAFADSGVHLQNKHRGRTHLVAIAIGMLLACKCRMSRSAPEDGHGKKTPNKWNCKVKLEESIYQTNSVRDKGTPGIRSLSGNMAWSIVSRRLINSSAVRIPVKPESWIKICPASSAFFPIIFAFRDQSNAFPYSANIFSWTIV